MSTDVAKFPSTDTIYLNDGVLAGRILIAPDKLSRLGWRWRELLVTKDPLLGSHFNTLCWWIKTKIEIRFGNSIQWDELQQIAAELREQAEPQAGSSAVAEQTMPVKDSTGDIVPDELIIGGKYGTCRDLTIDDVRAIVTRCRAFQAKGGKVPGFYDQLNIEPGTPRSFELETLRGWLNDPKFAPQEVT